MASYLLASVGAGIGAYFLKSKHVYTDPAYNPATNSIELKNISASYYSDASTTKLGPVYFSSYKGWNVHQGDAPFAHWDVKWWSLTPVSINIDTTKEDQPYYLYTKISEAKLLNRPYDHLLKEWDDKGYGDIAKFNSWPRHCSTCL
jgi:hypothetical protein